MIAGVIPGYKSRYVTGYDSRYDTGVVCYRGITVMILDFDNNNDIAF